MHNRHRQTSSASSYTTPKLDSRPSLDRCVIGCDINMDALWHYYDDRNIDRRRVCSTCMHKWPDLRRNFNKPYRAYSDNHPSADAAAHAAQAVCRGFLARVRMARRRARSQALGPPSQATPQQVHADASANPVARPRPHRNQDFSRFTRFIHTRQTSRSRAQKYFRSPGSI